MSDNNETLMSSVVIITLVVSAVIIYLYKKYVDNYNDLDSESDLNDYNQDSCSDDSESTSSDSEVELIKPFINEPTTPPDSESETESNHSNKSQQGSTKTEEENKQEKKQNTPESDFSIISDECSIESEDDLNSDKKNN